MKTLYSYLFLFLLFLPTNLHADRQTDEVLRKLDKSLAQRNQYEQQHLKRINSLKETMDYVKAHGRQFEQLYDLFQEYKSYCYDSARNYAYACLEVAELEKDQHRIVQAKNAIAFSLISAGILSEALEVMKSIDRRKLTGELLDGRLCEGGALLYEIYHPKQCLFGFAERNHTGEYCSLVVAYRLTSDA